MTSTPIKEYSRAVVNSQALSLCPKGVGIETLIILVKGGGDGRGVWLVNVPYLVVLCQNLKESKSQKVSDHISGVAL